MSSGRGSPGTSREGLRGLSSRSRKNPRSLAERTLREAVERSRLSSFATCVTATGSAFWACNGVHGTPHALGYGSLDALAEEEREETDPKPWLALQEWLASAAASRRVTIPYAKMLARMVPPVAVRLRRDFGAVLNLIRAHALLHQASRKKDDRGRVVATLADYAAVRGFMNNPG